MAIVISALALTGPMASTSSWKLTPRFLVGQEVAYAGQVTETRSGDAAVRYEQPYDLEASYLVFSVSPHQVAEIGCYTVAKLPDATKSAKGKETGAVHFDLVTVSASGAATWATNDAQITLPPDGRAPWELGYFLQVPTESVTAGRAWSIQRPGQPELACRVVDAEMVMGVTCVKLECFQQSKNWDADKSSLPAWQSASNVWIDPKEGVVQRVRRVFRVRDAGELKSDHEIITDYTLATNLRYHGPLLQERQSDFRLAFKAQSDLEHALALHEPSRRSRLSSIRQRLQSACEQLYSTPYRPAIKTLLAQVEAAEKKKDDGEDVVVHRLTGNPLHRKARSFVAHDVETNETVSLKKLAGKPTVLVFIDPTSNLCHESLETTLSAVKDHDPPITVLAIVNDSSESAVRRLRGAAPGNYAICSGRALDKAYRVRSFPHVVFIDGDGMLRGSIVGVGPETEATLVDAIKKYATGASDLSEQRNDKSRILR